MSSLLHSLVPTRALRDLGPEDTPRVTTMELFFDLVYVFTIIQLSHYLLEHASWPGGAGICDTFCCRLVGVELHGMGGELGQPGSRQRARAYDRPDGLCAFNGGGGTAGFRRTRGTVRFRLCGDGPDPGRLHGPGVSRSGDGTELCPAWRVERDLRHFLDIGRLHRARAPGTLDPRCRDRLCRTLFRLLAARQRGNADVQLDTEGAAFVRAQPV